MRDPVRCVGALVRDASGKLLLIQRGHEPERGRWSLPGGRVEAGETDHAALARELLEETGLRVRPGPLRGTVTRGDYEIFDYEAVIVDGTPAAADDAAALRFVTAEEFNRMDAAGLLTTDLAETLRSWGAL